MQPNASKWNLVPDSVQTTGDHLGVEATLKHEINGATLKLTLRSLLEDGGVLNLHLSEVKSERARFEAKEALLESITRVKLHLIESNDSGFKVQFGRKDSNKYLAHVHASPFRVDVFDGDQLILTGNERGLFKFEHFRKKDSEPTVSEADQQQQNALEPVDGAWDETFRSFADSKPFGPMAVAMDWNFVGFDHVYGIPEHADSFALKDTKGHSDPYRLYNLDVFEYELNSPMALYGSVPMMLAHSAQRTIGLLWLNPSETWIDIESSTGGLFSNSKTKSTHWISETGVIDVYIMMGPRPTDVMQQNARLVGATPLPPYYSIGHHQSRWNYFSQEEVRAVEESFDEHNIPVDAIWLDIEYTENRLKKYFTWDKLAFSDHKTLITNLTSKGRRLIAIIDPHLKKADGYSVYEEGRDNHYFLKNANSDDQYEGWCWPDASMYPDYVNPTVREWWSNKFKPSFFPGFEGGIVDIWNDMNEPSVFNGPEVTAPKDLRHSNGWEHRDVHNMYGFYMTKATHTGLVTHRPNFRPFILTRSFFAGSQRHVAAWTGDNMSKWEHLRAAIPMLLSLSSVGISFSGADVPGFFFQPESDELVVRWYQAGAFQPFFRAHAHIDTKRREPFTFTEPIRELISQSIKLRYTYLPYIYTQFAENARSGVPPLRPLWFQFPEDEATFALDQSHLVGDSLLVQPVSEPSVDHVQVYLPDSKQVWLHLQTGQVYPGGQTHRIPVDLSSIPLFQRGGSVIARRERVRRAAALTLHDPLTLDVFLDAHHSAAAGRIYLDDGISFDYERDDQFIDGLFSFADNRLQFEVIRGQLKTPVTVERIRIYDYPKRPYSVSAHVHDKQLPLQFTYDQNTHTLVVRKPDLSMKTSWTVSIQ